MPAATSRKITEPWTTEIETAAAWLCPADRDQFRAAVAAELGDRELGPGNVSRAIRAAFRAFYRPLQIDHQEPMSPTRLRNQRTAEPIL